jgi:murein DD-endopeptidase MepM/ murein hydrolase activator NlpD
MMKLIHTLFKNSARGIVPVQLDFSSLNERLKEIDLDNSEQFEQFIQDEISIMGGNCGIGGYLEERVIYRRSSHYENADEPRCMHLGVDIWINVGTEVFVCADGIIHSAAINNTYGDYGGTIILEHQFNNSKIYSLYGHLSHESIANARIGALIQQSEFIGKLGSWNENGNWPAHLHFQLIRDLQGNLGDYPGVCSKTDLPFYQENCPNPMTYNF